MPKFSAYDYVFSLEKLKIPLEFVNLQGFFVGWLNFLVPWIYQRHLAKRDYIVMFAIAQAVYFLAEVANTVLVQGWNLLIGIPNIVLYLLGGSLAGIFDGGFHNFASYMIFGKMTPQGIDSTMS